MKQIYLNLHQCDLFEMPYFDAHEGSWLNASEIIKSRRSEYDPYHRNILEPLGAAPVLLWRNKEHGPGWYSTLVG